MKMNEIYEAPVMEVLKVALEAGFAGSEPDEDDAIIPGTGAPGKI